MDPLILDKVKDSLQALMSEKVLGMADGEDIDITFVAPNRDFVEKLSSKPAINCYLIGLSEDKHRRRSDPMRSQLDDSKTKHTMFHEPRYVDITYMITVWSKDKDGSAMIEHILLGYLLSGLGYFDTLPQDIQQEKGLQSLPFGIRLTLFGSEYADKISGQVWQAMGASPKPCLMLSLSVPVPVAEPEERAAIQDIRKALERL